jgi:hypothetical protein
MPKLKRHLVELNVIEAAIIGWLEADIHIDTILIALSNASVHGQYLPGITEKKLNLLFEGYDTCRKAVKDL